MSIHVSLQKNRREVCDACGRMAKGFTELKIVHDSAFAGEEDCPGHPVTVCHFCLPEVIGQLVRAEESAPLRSVNLRTKS